MNLQQIWDEIVLEAAGIPESQPYVPGWISVYKLVKSSIQIAVSREFKSDSIGSDGNIVIHRKRLDERAIGAAIMRLVDMGQLLQKHFPSTSRGPGGLFFRKPNVIELLANG